MPAEETFPRDFGIYRLLARLGEGMSGAVYLAQPLDRSRGLPSRVVIKRLHDRHRGQPELLKRFRHEAELARRVQSAHVARVYEVGEAEDGAVYFAMEYVAGTTVAAALARGGVTMPIEVAVEIAAQLLEGLADVHRTLEAVHRDLAPKNVIVGEDGCVKIIDFGVGKSRAQDWRTESGVVIGTPGYMAPEQISGGEIDRRTDVYSAGVVLFELLTGERWVAVDAQVLMLRQTLAGPYRRPSGIRAEIPRALDEVVRTAVEREAVHRFQSAAEMSAALASAGVVRAGRARTAEFFGAAFPEERATVFAEVAAPVRRRPRRGTAAMVAGVLAVIAGGAVGMVSWSERERPASVRVSREPAAVPGVRVIAREGEGELPVLKDSEPMRRGRSKASPVVPELGTEIGTRTGTGTGTGTDREVEGTVEARIEGLRRSLRPDDPRSSEVTRLRLGLARIRGVADAARRAEQLRILEGELAALEREN